MRVVLAIDHSKHSLNAFRFLAELPCAQSINLEVIAVLTPVPLLSIGDGGMIAAPINVAASGILADEKRAAKEALAKTTAEFSDLFKTASSAVKIGSPSREIVMFAESTQADLVVMGAVGHSSIARILLGSVSDYVATHAKASTVVVRPSLSNENAIPPTRVMIAVGMSDQDQRSIDWIRRFQLPASTQVHIVHVLEEPSSFRQELLRREPEIRKHSDSLIGNHLAALEASCKVMGYTTNVAALEESHVGEALLNYASDNGCDLVLASDQHKGVVDRLLLGSTTRYLLRHSPTSVMVTRD